MAILGHPQSRRISLGESSLAKGFSHSQRRDRKPMKNHVGMDVVRRWPRPAWSLIIIVASSLFLVPLRSGAQPLFVEDWSSGTIDTVMYLYDEGNHSGPPYTIEEDPPGSGDLALRVGDNGGSDWSEALFLHPDWTGNPDFPFARGNNIRCTFDAWDHPDVERVDWPRFAALNGPWHHFDDTEGPNYASLNSQPFDSVEAGIVIWMNWNGMDSSRPKWSQLQAWTSA